MNENSFEYNYSASEQQEIRKIREKYAPCSEKEDKLSLLRKLDADAEKPGTVLSLVLGVAGTLLLGVGMCCTMLWNTSTMIFVLGIVVGLVGIIMISLAYPVYKKITLKQREKIAPQIIALAEELEK